VSREGRPGEGAAPQDPVTDHPQRNGFHRPTDLWRDEFRRGAVDALRLACREIGDPDVWLVLERLADYYNRDDYGLAQ
jgi:hypothetical protein